MVVSVVFVSLRNVPPQLLFSTTAIDRRPTVFWRLGTHTGRAIDIERMSTTEVYDLTMLMVICTRICFAGRESDCCEAGTTVGRP